MCPKSVNVKVPHKSGFDKSFKHLFTSKVGTLVPVLCDEIIPDTKIHLRSAVMAQLPPLATDTFMNVKLKFEAFFCPTRLLYGGFESWLTHEKLKIPTQSNSFDAYIPRLVLKNSGASAAIMVQPGSLLDYLGLKAVEPLSPDLQAFYNIFPVLCYHKVWEDYYRNPNIQSKCFAPILAGAQQSQIYVYNMPYLTLDSSISESTIGYTPGAILADGVKLGDLRQRNFGFDYFTTAMSSAQRGDALKVSIDTSDNTFTIGALRMSNSLQQFAERNMMAGTRLQDYVKAHYGADLSSGVAQRSIYLGSGELDVYNKGVYTQSALDFEPVLTGGRNPFIQSPASKFGDAKVEGELSLVEEFTASEPGYLMVMCSLVPKVTYSAGIRRMFRHYNKQNTQVDMATPLLENVGNQPIYADELTGNIPDYDDIFGYTDRYSEFKHVNDMLSGFVRDGQSLQAFALQRAFEGTPQISSEFLQIPTDFLDQVMSVDGEISDFQYWADVYFDYKVSMPLSQYAIPSLQDPAYEHGRNVNIQVNGSSI